MLSLVGTRVTHMAVCVTASLNHIAWMMQAWSNCLATPATYANRLQPKVQMQCEQNRLFCVECVVAKDNQPSVCDEFAKGADAQCDGQYLKRCDLFVFPFLEELHHTYRRFHVAIILPAPCTHLLDSQKIIHKPLTHLPSWTKTAAIRGGVLLASA